MLLRWCFQGLGRWWPTSLRRVPLRHAPGGKAAAVFRPWQSGAVCQWEKQWKTESGIPVWMENWHYCIILNGNTIFTDDLMIKWWLMVFQNPFKETKLIGSDQYIYYICIYIYYLSKTYMGQLLSDVSYHLQFESNEKNWRCQPASPKKLWKITILNHHFELPKSHYPKRRWKLMFSCFDREIHRNWSIYCDICHGPMAHMAHMTDTSGAEKGANFPAVCPMRCSKWPQWGWPDGGSVGGHLKSWMGTLDFFSTWIFCSTCG